MSTFCSLCGVLVDMWRGGDLSDRPDPSEALSWLTEVRAIRTSRFIHDPVVTGVGWLNFHGDIIAPREDSCHYADPNLEQDLEDYFGRYRLGYSSYTNPDYWCYVVHDVCWELLRDRIGPTREVPARTLARHLFALLYNTPADDEGVFAPGHDYGHAAEFQDTSSSHGYFTRVNASENSFITGDAREEFQFEDEVLQDTVPSASDALPTPAALGNYSESDIFCLLPNEIMMLILAPLPSADVCRLRLASRYVADVSSPGALSQRFWSSRFDPDSEMGFVFAGPFCPRPKEPVDWRMLYTKAKVALKSDLFPGLRNRRRIWQTFQDLMDTLGSRLVNEAWISDYAYNRTQPTIPEGARLSHSVCAEASFDPGDPGDIDMPAKRPLLVSCRLFERQSVHWPQEFDADSLKLGVSFVYANSRHHICGLRCFSPGNSDGVIEYSRAGLINPRKEQQFSLQRYDSLECLDVVMATTGLVGLHFHIKGPQNSYNFSVGDAEVVCSESGVARLTPTESRACLGLVLGLDACKVISISLIEKQLYTPTIYRTNGYNDSSLTPVELWNPTLPETPHPTSWCFPGPSPVQHFDLCLNMDFGGPEGRLLQSLTRVDLFMGGFPAVFLGMSFHYADGSERVYGRRRYRENIDNMTNLRAVQQSLHIDGPKGEVITKVTVSYSSICDTIQSMTIDTNMSRPQQFRLYGKESWGDCEELVEVLEPKPGEVFTSFYVKIKSPLGYFQNITTRSLLPCELLSPQGVSHSSNDSHRVPITCKALNSAAEMLAYPRGFVFTAADISHLKMVRVSVAKEGHPPLPMHISGLRLEYADSKIPVVLGQWIEEFGSLRILPNDRLVQLTTWHDFKYTHKRVKFGQIRKLQLGTASGTSKEFLDPMVRDNICLNYQENPYEELVGLVWGYNHEWDHVRALYGPKASSRGNPLIVGPASHLNPTWLVRERLFMREILEDGRPNPVVGIEVTYKDIGSEPSGLTLIYEHGEQRTLGTRGRSLHTMMLSEGEQLVRMDVGVDRGNRIDLISFFTNTGRKVDFSGKRNPDIHHRLVFMLDPLATTVESTTSKLRSLREFPEGAGRFVGFWAVPKRCDRTLRFNMLGPVFETASREGVDGSGTVAKIIRDAKLQQGGVA